MTKTLIGLGDRMLSALLKEKQAGACYEVWGEACNDLVSGWCDGGWWWETRVSGRYTCMGDCVGTTYTVRGGYGC